MFTYGNFAILLNSFSIFIYYAMEFKLVWKTPSYPTQQAFYMNLHTKERNKTLCYECEPVWKYFGWLEN